MLAWIPNAHFSSKLNPKIYLINILIIGKDFFHPDFIDSLNPEPNKTLILFGNKQELSGETNFSLNIKSPKNLLNNT